LISLKIGGLTSLKAHGGPFRVDGPDIHYHFVADAQLIKEIDHAPRDVLSLQAAAKTVRPVTNYGKITNLTHRTAAAA
jgi:hypothetical protein